MGGLLFPPPGGSTGSSGGAVNWKASVATVGDLPASGNTVGDARITQDTFLIYVWNGSSWVAAAPTTDLSNYLKRDGTNSPSSDVSWGGYQLTNVGNAVIGPKANPTLTITDSGTGYVTYSKLQFGSSTGQSGGGKISFGPWDELWFLANGEMYVGNGLTGQMIFGNTARAGIRIGGSDTPIYWMGDGLSDIGYRGDTSTYGRPRNVYIYGGLHLREATNSRMGTATLSSGAVTVANTSVTTNTRIFVQRQTDGGTVGASYSISRLAGTSFTISAKDGSGADQTADSSTVAWLLVEPN